jgi:tRNA(Ile)-lysidine synthase
LAAVSGGPDSVALLHSLRGLPFQTVVGHVDHGLRPSSIKDAAFVRTLAERWDFDFLLEQVPVRTQAAKQKQGIEETARELRYKSLLTMARKKRCQAILTGHHREDQAETVLFNFLRGSGPLGLAGMPAARPLAKDGPLLIRPLLTVSREAIRRALQAHRLTFRTDPTNRSLAYSRNRIRHETLPLLLRDFPGLTDRLAQQADLFAEEEQFWAKVVAPELRKTARQNKQKLIIDLKNLFRYHKALGRRLLRTFLPGLSFQELERVYSLAQQPNKIATLLLSSGSSVSKKADHLIISAKSGPGAKRSLGHHMRNV